MTRSRTALVATALSVALVLALVLAGCAAPNSSQNQNPQSSTETSSFGTSGETSTGISPETSTTTTMPPETTTTTPPSTTTTGTTGGTGTTTKTWMMKQKVKIGDWTIWVQSRSFMRAVAGVKAPSGKQLVEIKLWVMNRGKKTASLMPTDFKLMDSQGNELPMAKVKGSRFLAGTSKKNVKAGMQKMYRLVFEVPKSEKNLKLEFMPTGVTGTTTQVDIQLKMKSGTGTSDTDTTQ